ncbi:MAG: NAD(P)H-hydrate dehydratase [Candidatus Peribacteraceae bacterium]|nr:NAD(P)H-hydrate dehydratase [Candidatus Peribacteraceae bacterium]MDD5074802.1 NAD(P)H-hydrate dehydratase [Candidatus Peribacteraceae bacterium]
MERSSDSHKGENGKVAVIGGSLHMHGAPLFSALAAEASGADLVFVCLPACHAEVAKTTSLNFQVHPFSGNDLRPADTESILELLATMDSAVLGPGITHGDTQALKALKDIIAEAPCGLVLDASALQPYTLSLVKGKSVVLTPHMAELERMEISLDDIGSCAEDAGVTIFAKGPMDSVATPDGEVSELIGGNPGLTAGGTGDVLAGLIAGLMAQKMEGPDAALLAGTIIKHAAEELEPEFGFSFGALRVIDCIPHLLRTLTNE